MDPTDSFLHAAALTPVDDLFRVLKEYISSSPGISQEEVKVRLDTTLLTLAPESLTTSSEKKDYIQNVLPKLPHSKCRCDAQWYATGGGETNMIAFGCKTCGMSSASCICAACFDAGDHQGHDYYISKSDYGCCDCGDIYAWKKTGFCKSHPGPDPNVDPSVYLDPRVRRIGTVLANVYVELLAPTGYAANGGLIQSVCETIQTISAMHDGLRRIMGLSLLHTSDGETVNALLRVSHSLPPDARQAWTNVLVDLMLDLEFKASFATVFASHYAGMISSRLHGRSKMSDIGDITCQMLTRPDIAQTLVLSHNWLSTMLDSMTAALRQCCVELNPIDVDAAPWHLPPEFDFLPPRPPLQNLDADHLYVISHSHAWIRSHEVFQSSIDLMYTLDHPLVVDAILSTPTLLHTFTDSYLTLLSLAQYMNPHRKRTDVHVLYPDAFWANALTTQAELMSAFFLFMEGIWRIGDSEAKRAVILVLVEKCAKKVAEWTERFTRLEEKEEVESMMLALHRVLGLVLARAVECAVNEEEVRDVLEVAFRGGMSGAAGVVVKTRSFQSQASLGDWTRNGESVTMETEFYRSVFFHHHMSSSDLDLIRLSLFRSDVDVNDQLVAISAQYLLAGSHVGLTGLLRLVSELLSPPTGAARNSRQRVIDQLAVQDRSFSQLRDPKVEKWTHTLMPTHNETLEAVVAQVASPVAGGGIFTLNDSCWFEVDLMSPHWTWKDMQKADEQLREFLERKSLTPKDWFRSHRAALAPVQPSLLSSFTRLLSAEALLGILFLTCVELLKDSSDSRALRALVQILLRFSLQVGPDWLSPSTNQCSPQCPPHQLESITVESLSRAFASRGWCHPWSVRVNWSECVGGESILSMLTLLKNREEGSDMKRWLELAIDEISNQCGITRQTTSLGSTEGVISSAVSAAEKRKLMQQKLMERLTKKQNAFLANTTSTTAAFPETAIAPAPIGMTDEQCVICLAVEGEGRPLAKFAFVAGTSRPAFNPCSRMTVRSCNHAVHMDCMERLFESQNAQISARGFLQCPYCNRPANTCFASDNSNLAVVLAILSKFNAGFESAQLAKATDEDDSFLVTLLKAIQAQIDQLVMNHREPSSETDIASLEKGLSLLVHALVTVCQGRPELVAQTTGYRAALFWVLAMKSMTKSLGREIDLDGSKELFRDTSIAVLSGRPLETETERLFTHNVRLRNWLSESHVVWKYLVDPSHTLPFEEIVAVESASSLEDEISILTDQLPFPLHLLDQQTDSTTTPPTEVVPFYGTVTVDTPTSSTASTLESFTSRERLRSISPGPTTRVIEYIPSITWSLPQSYQKLYTQYLNKPCDQCGSSSRIPKLCLLCDKFLCCSDTCASGGELGQVASHFTNGCAPNGVGVVLQISTSIVHLVWCDVERVQVAQWGSLYLDSHGEEDPTLSRPLELNAGRLAMLNNELRANSWVWSMGNKNRNWLRTVGI